MNLTEFFEAADQLTTWVGHLDYSVKNVLPQAEDALVRKDQPPLAGVPAEAMAGLCVREIRGRVEEVMAAYNRVVKALGMYPYFEMFFHYLEAPPHVREEIRGLLKRTCAS